MQQQDEKQSECLQGCADDDLLEDSGSLALPQVTADGYDYGTLLAVFQDVVDALGPTQPQPGFFLAPGTSCTFSVH